MAKKNISLHLEQYRLFELAKNGQSITRICRISWIQINWWNQNFSVLGSDTEFENTRKGSKMRHGNWSTCKNMLICARVLAWRVSCEFTQLLHPLAKKKESDFLMLDWAPNRNKGGISAKTTKLKSTIPAAFGQKPRSKMVSRTEAGKFTQRGWGEAW